MERTFSVQCPDHLKAFSAPSYQKNLAKTKYADQTVCCVLCGKLAEQSTLYVVLANTSEYITKEEYSEEECDLGNYPIGSDCAKKLQKAGIPVYSHQEV